MTPRKPGDGPRFGITRDEDGKVQVSFGANLAWLVLEPTTAVDFARKLAQAAGCVTIVLDLPPMPPDDLS